MKETAPIPVSRFKFGKIIMISLAGLAVVLTGSLVGYKLYNDSIDAQQENQTPTLSIVSPSESGGNAEVPMAAVSYEDALQILRDCQKSIQTVDGYTCTFIKSEMKNGKMPPHDTIFMKIRHEPFSVYMRFDGPPSEKGVETIYVDGKYNGDMVSHGVGLKKLAGTQFLDPEGTIAGLFSSRPITCSGVKYIIDSYLTQHERDPEYLNCKVSIHTAEFDGRECQVIQLTFNEPQGDFRVAKSITAIDKVWKIPVRFELHKFSEDDGEPQLVEEYSFLNYDPEVELTEEDFDYKNPKYGY